MLKASCMVFKGMPDHGLGMEKKKVNKVGEGINEGPPSSTNTRLNKETLLQRHSPQLYSEGIQGSELLELCFQLWLYHLSTIDCGNGYRMFQSLFIHLQSGSAS